jgi:hypothetical protein
MGSRFAIDRLWRRMAKVNSSMKFGYDLRFFDDDSI